MKKKIVLITSVCVLIIGIIISILIINNFDNKKILGIWTADNVTYYEFNKDKTGKLKVSLNEYEFAYKLNDNKLFIYYKDDTIEDIIYTYEVSKKKLSLSGKNGEFVFEKVK